MDPSENVLKETTHLQSSIVSQIIDGSITIDSLGEYQSMLKIFQDNPYLHRGLADLLVRRRSLAAAADYYDKAAHLFIHSGMVLQAIVARMLQWQIAKPDIKAIKQFYHALLEHNPRTTPLEMFFASLSFHELTALITRLERFILPPGKVIKKFGDIEANLYMVVSGKLMRRTYPRANPPPTDAQLVETPEMEAFGNVFPLEMEHRSQSATQTTSRVEFARLTRESLIDLCGQYPSMATSLAELFNNLARQASRRQVERRAQRHTIAVRIRLAMLHDDDPSARNPASGITRDLSIGGACILLDEPVETDQASAMIGKEARMTMSLPNEAMTVTIRGRVVWSRNLMIDGKSSHAVGLQFQPMPPNLSGLLLVFAENLDHAR